MQIAICDDDPDIRTLLAGKIQHLYPHARICFYESGEALSSIEQPPDILLLDIQMTGISGMEAARRLRQKQWPTILIFVTALEEYVFEAFDVGAFHYLVKPFHEEKFVSVLQNAVAQYEAGLPAAAFTTETHHKPEQFLLVKSGSSHIRIFFKDIVYAEVFNRKIIVHKMNEDIEYYGRLSELQKQAGNDFFRTHRAYLVHFRYVVRYDSSRVWLEKGSALMGKKRYQEFVTHYMKYMMRTVHAGESDSD